MEYQYGEVEIKDSTKGHFTLLRPANCDDIFYSHEFQEFVNLMIDKYPIYHPQMVQATNDYIASHLNCFNTEDDEEDE